MQPSTARLPVPADSDRDGVPQPSLPAIHSITTPGDGMAMRFREQALEGHRGPPRARPGRVWASLWGPYGRETGLLLATTGALGGTRQPPGLCSTRKWLSAGGKPRWAPHKALDEPGRGAGFIGRQWLAAGLT